MFNISAHKRMKVFLQKDSYSLDTLLLPYMLLTQSEGNICLQDYKNI